jgi:predicted O-methyltransferase YrrM
MTIKRLADSLLQGKPYFGHALQARQGVPFRHSYFLPIVRAQKRIFGSKPLRILEIGSWAGASAVSWAHALAAADAHGSVLCIDPWESYFDLTVEKTHFYSDMNAAAADGSIFKLFQHNITTSGFREISFMRGSSNDMLPTLADKSYEIIFLDGSHSYHNIAFDIAQARRLITDGGVICGDDLELQSGELPAAEHQAALASAAEWIWSSAAEMSYHPGVTQAVDEAFGPVSVWDGLWAVRAEAGQWREVELNLQNLTLPPHLADELRYDQAEQEAEASLRHHEIRMIEETANHNIVQAGDRFIAIAKSLGAVRLFSDRLGERELAPVLLIGTSLQDVVTKSKKTMPEDVIGTQVAETQLYNIAQFGNTFVAIAKTLGPVNLGKDLIGARTIGDFILVDENLEKTIKDAQAAEQRLAPPAVKQLADTAAFNIVQVGNQIIAVAKSLGPINLLNEPLGAREIDGVILTGNYLGEIMSRVAEVEAERARWRVEKVAETKMYNVVQFGAQFAAVAKSLGPVVMGQERIGERSIGALILAGPTLDATLAQAAAAEREADAELTVLIDETRDYNIVKAGDRFVAISKLLGHAELFRERLGERDLVGVIVAGSSLVDVKSRAQALEAAKDEPAVELVGETQDYNIVRAGTQFAAFAKSLGHLEAYRERLGERDLDGVIVTGSSLVDVKSRALALEAAKDEPVAELVGETQDYNIVRAGTQFAAFAKSLGHLEAYRERLGERELSDLILTGADCAELIRRATIIENAKTLPQQGDEIATHAATDHDELTISLAPVTGENHLLQPPGAAP